MKIIVTGANGQLGSDIMNELKKRKHNAIGTDIGEMDITDRDSVEKYIARVAPDAVIHCAAWTDVDRAELEENAEKVRDINVVGTKNIAEICGKIGCKIIYISTDYVFDGVGTEPWKPNCKDFNPLNYYGKTKLEGEEAVVKNAEKFFIVRISWVFGTRGKNFVKTMLTLGTKYKSIRVVNDQIGTPTYTVDLASLLVDMAESEKYGYYHASNEGGYISWYDFAREIFIQAGIDTEVISVTAEEYGNVKAARPQNSRLDKSELKRNGFKSLPDWKDALKRYLEEFENGTN